jgi:hypothetical protein
MTKWIPSLLTIAALAAIPVASAQTPAVPVASAQTPAVPVASAQTPAVPTANPLQGNADAIKAGSGL